MFGFRSRETILIDKITDRALEIYVSALKQPMGGTILDPSLNSKTNYHSARAAALVKQFLTDIKEGVFGMELAGLIERKYDAIAERVFPKIGVSGDGPI